MFVLGVVLLLGLLWRTKPELLERLRTRNSSGFDAGEATPTYQTRSTRERLNATRAKINDNVRVLTRKQAKKGARRLVNEDDDEMIEVGGPDVRNAISSTEVFGAEDLGAEDGTRDREQHTTASANGGASAACCGHRRLDLSISALPLPSVPPPQVAGDRTFSCRPAILTDAMARIEADPAGPIAAVTNAQFDVALSTIIDKQASGGSVLRADVTVL